MGNEKPYPKRKSSLLWIIVGLVVLLAGAFGIYQAMSRRQQAVVPTQAEIRVKITQMPVSPKGDLPEISASRSQVPNQDQDSLSDDHETVNSPLPTPAASVAANEPITAGQDEPQAPMPPQPDTTAGGETAVAMNQIMKNASPDTAASVDEDQPTTTESSQAEAPMTPPAETTATSASEKAGDLEKAQPDGKTDHNTEISQVSAPYTIQVGAFRTKAYAEKSMAQLKSKGYDSYINEITGKHQRAWYLVRFGHFQDRSSAAKALTNFKEQEKMDGQVSQLKND